MSLQDIFDRSNAISRRRPVPVGNTIRCADGFAMSVISGWGTYCTPRPGLDAPDDYDGPFTAVEVGFPTSRPEPWKDWARYCDDPEEPSATVYGPVPVEVVRALVEFHGGEL